MTSENASFIQSLKRVEKNETVENFAWFFSSLDVALQTGKFPRGHEVDFERFVIVREELVKRKIFNHRTEDFPGHYVIYQTLEEALDRRCSSRETKNYYDPLENLYEILCRNVPINDSTLHFLDECIMKFRDRYDLSGILLEGKKEENQPVEMTY